MSSSYPRTHTTARLRAEAPKPGHVAGLAEVCARPEVADWMWPAHLGGPRTTEQVEQILARDAAHWLAKDFGMWVLSELEGERVVGQGGLQYTVVGGRAEVEVGWLLHPDVWGRGYAAEITAAAVELAPRIRGLESVVGFTMVENRRARRTMERCGFAYERDVTVVELPHVLYRRAAGAAS